jgi:hypothetical protein
VKYSHIKVLQKGAIMGIKKDSYRTAFLVQNRSLRFKKVAKRKNSKFLWLLVAKSLIEEHYQHKT